MDNLHLGTDARLRGETVNVRHVLRVPKSRDIFGSPLRAHWRAVVVYDDGRWNDHVNLHELVPIEQA